MKPHPGGSGIRRWRYAAAWRMLVWLLLIGAVLAGLLGLVMLQQRISDNRVLTALSRGEDVAVSLDARPEVLAARVRFLVYRTRFDEAAPLVAHLRERAPELAADALFNRANAYLREALELIDNSRFDDAIAQVNLAKLDYRQALRLRPDDWEMKYNFDIAMRLVRDFPAANSEGEEEPGTPPDKLWTDLPGRPRGMP